MVVHQFLLLLLYHTTILFIDVRKAYGQHEHQRRSTDNIDKTNTIKVHIPSWKRPCLERGDHIRLHPSKLHLPTSSMKIPDFLSNYLELVSASNTTSTNDNDEGIGSKTFDRWLQLTVKHRICLFRPAQIPIQYSTSSSNNKGEGDRISHYRILHIQHRSFLGQQHGRQKRTVGHHRRRNSNEIRFEKTEYRVNLTEEGVSGQLVVRVHADNPDGLPLFYSFISLQDGRSDKYFRLNRTTGELRTWSRLDRELMSEHHLKVVAKENGNPSRTASSSVIIQVLDINDHTPVFEKKTFIASIPESAEIGTTILHVHARDADDRENGMVRYSFEHPDVRLFSIDPITGIVQVAQKLDRENQDFYRLSVRASDQSVDELLESTALIEITLLDANDNYPAFEKDSYSVDIPENLDFKTKPIVASIKASDADFGENGKVHYSIVSGNLGDTFAIDYETGDLRLIKELSYKSHPIYQLVVRAQDGGSIFLSNTTIAEINVLDVNDNPPRFYTEKYEQNIRENVPKNSLIAMVQAFDPDDGKNADIHYKIVKSRKEEYLPFKIDETSGRIVTSELLDREKNSFFDFSVEAMDSGVPPLSSKVQVLVTVSDVNDNRPVFTAKTYNFTIREDAERGQNVGEIKAVDRDESSSLTYAITSGNTNEDTFVIINSDGLGILTLNALLNYQKKSVYQLNVRATDVGGKFDNAMVYISVTDVNSAPYFVGHSYSETVVESEGVNGTVAVIEASDNDSGDNARLVYSLYGADGHFDIHPLKGVITIARQLDREERPNYNLEVQVRDHGSPSLMASTTLEIILSDVNDNAPVFAQSNYTVSIMEDTPVGTSFLQVTAVDADSGQNAAILYYFDQESDNQTFFIDPSSGIIRILEPLDRETQEVYHLKVLGIDKGQPSQTGTTVVSVIIEDKNDNPPRFEQSEYSLYVSEDKPMDSIVGLIVARDIDKGTNALIKYTISGGKDMGSFGLQKPKDGEGVNIVSRTSLDYESSVNTYHLQLKASSGDLSSTVEVTIRVQDTNDNAPELHDFFLIFNNYPEYFPMENLGRIPAHDPDDNDTLTYSIPKGNEAGLLILNAETGGLQLSPNLNTNRHISTKLTACVTDGANEVCASCWLRVILVTPEMLLESVTIRASGRSRDELLSPVPFSRIIDAIATLIPSQRDNVIIFSIQENRNDLTSFASYQPMTISSEPLVNISFAILEQNAQQDFVKANRIRELIDVSRMGLGQVGGINILPLEESLCVREPCPNFKRCETVLRFGAASKGFITTQDFLFRPIDPIATFRCVCPRGFAAKKRIDACDTEVNLCYSSPCGSNGTCIPKEGGYTCSCPPTRTDGANEVCASCWLRVILVTPEMLLESVTIRASGRSRDELLSPVPFSRIIDAIATLIPSQRDNVIIFSIQENRNDLTSFASYQPMTISSEPLVNISFAILEQNAQQDFVKANRIRELIDVSRMGLGQVGGINILPLEESLCVREPCPNFKRCETVLRFGAASKGFITTQDFLFRPIDPIATFRCVCPRGFAAKKRIDACDTEVNLCYSSPCGSNGTCIPKEGGYTCSCPPTRTGKHCEFPLVSQFCVPGICGAGQCTTESGTMECKSCPHKPKESTKWCQLRGRSFERGNYLTLPGIKGRNGFKLSLSLATIESDSLLLYNGRYQAEHDYFALIIQDGLPKIQFSTGGLGWKQISLPDLDYNRVNDGQWHEIFIHYHQRKLRLSLDDCNEEIAVNYGQDIGYKGCAVEMEYKLENNCTASSVMCYRYLDLTGPLYVGGLPNRKISRLPTEDPVDFDGCIGDMFVDNEMIDFGSAEIERQGGGSRPGCQRLSSDVCHAHDRKSSPCRRSKECTSVWNGHQCSCKEGWAGRNCSEQNHLPALHLDSSDSYVEYNGRDISVSLPLTLATWVRTRQLTGKPLTVILNRGEIRLALRISNGLCGFEVESNRVEQSYPKVSDGKWHHLSVHLTPSEIQLTVDYIYETEIKWTSPKHLMGILDVTKAFVGSLPGTSNVTPFLGCVKGAALAVGKRRPLEYLLVESHYGTQKNCNPPSSCLNTPCPLKANCLTDWDTHKCQCLPGYFGENCISACSLKGLCRNGGKCKKRSSAIGYECVCPPGWTGEHCETAVGGSGWKCPNGWWGSPMCGPCHCDTGRGYSQQCHKITGKCQCQENHYKPPGSSVCYKCDCNYPDGAVSEQCDRVTGQCQCRGDVTGRRCRSCPSPTTMEINGKTGYCQKVGKGFCGGSIAGGINWELQSAGRQQSKSCPTGASVGTALRYCTSRGEWQPPNLSNCTSIPFVKLAEALGKVDGGLINMSNFMARRIVRELKNATRAETTVNPAEDEGLYQQDVYIAYRLLITLLRQETNKAPQASAHLTHLQDKNFVQDLMESVSSLVSERNRRGWNQLNRGAGGKSGGILLDNLDGYGQMLAKLHSSADLKPFIAAPKDIMFSIDTTKPNQKAILPKFDNYLPPLKRIPFQIGLPKTKKSRTVFYGVFDSIGQLIENDKYRIISPVISVSIGDDLNKEQLNAHEWIDLIMPIRLAWNVTDPRCARWLHQKHVWSEDNCETTYRNYTHMLCSCNHLSSFAVIADDVSSGRNGGRRPVSDMIFRILFPAVSILSLILLTMILVLILVLRSTEGPSNRRAIQLNIVLAAFLNVSAFACITLAEDYPMGCLAVGTVLHLSSLALVFWLFLASTHLYRSVIHIADINKSPFWPYLILGWIAPVCFAAVVPIVNPSSFHGEICWFRVTDQYVWLMIGPILFMSLLIIYVNTMCGVIGFSKDWDFVFAKLNFRSSLGWLIIIDAIIMAHLFLTLFSVNLPLIWLRYTQTGATLTAVIVLLFWVAYNDRNSQADLKTAVNLWLTEDEHNKAMTQSINVPNPPGNGMEYENVPAEEGNDNDRRSDSPFLADDCAPVDEEERDLSMPENHEDGMSPSTFDNYHRNARESSASIDGRRRWTKNHCGPSDNLDDSTTPFLPPPNSSPSAYNHFTKPDLIPKWENGQQRSNGSPLAYFDTNTSSKQPYKHYTKYRSTAYSNTLGAKGYSSTSEEDASPGGILSPVQKVLFGSNRQNMEEEMIGGSGRGGGSSENMLELSGGGNRMDRPRDLLHSGFSTFSPRRTNGTTVGGRLHTFELASGQTPTSTNTDQTYGSTSTLTPAPHSATAATKPSSFNNSPQFDYHSASTVPIGGLPSSLSPSLAAISSNEHTPVNNHSKLVPAMIISQQQQQQQQPVTATTTTFHHQHSNNYNNNTASTTTPRSSYGSSSTYAASSIISAASNQQQQHFPSASSPASVQYQKYDDRDATARL